MNRQVNPSGSLTASITKSSSRQAYYTIRLLADRDRIVDAYRAYRYFRWVDDVIDGESGSALSGGSRLEIEAVERIAFADRQKSLLESCYRGEIPNDLYAEEWMLVNLVRNDTEKNSGLQACLRNMMDVMVFDATRRGRVIIATTLKRSFVT